MIRKKLHTKRYTTRRPSLEVLETRQIMAADLDLFIVEPPTNSIDELPGEYDAMLDVTAVESSTFDESVHDPSDQDLMPDQSLELVTVDPELIEFATVDEPEIEFGPQPEQNVELEEHDLTENPLAAFEEDMVESGPSEADTADLTQESDTGGTIQQLAYRAITAHAVRAQAAHDTNEAIVKAQTQREASLQEINTQLQRDKATAEQQFKVTEARAEDTLRKELSRFEQNLRKGINTAESNARKVLNSLSSNLNNQLKHLGEWSKQRVQAAKNAATTATNKVTSEFDRVSRSLRDWYQKTIKKLPGWMQKLSKYVGKHLTTFNRGIAEARGQLQEAASKIQKGLQTQLGNLGRSLKQATDNAWEEYEKAKKNAQKQRDNLTSSAKAEYKRAEQKVLATRDKAVRNAVEVKNDVSQRATETWKRETERVEKEFQAAVDSAVEQREQLVDAAGRQIQAVTLKLDEIHSQVVDGRLDVLERLAKELPDVNRDLLTTLLKDVEGRIRAAGVKFDQQILQHIEDVLTNPVGELHDRLFDPLQDVRVLTSFLDQTVLGGQLSERWHEDVQDPAVRNLLNANLGLYLQRNFSSEHYHEVYGEQGGQAVYYVNGMITPKGSAIERAESLAWHLNRPIRLIHNSTASQAEDSVQSFQDKFWRPPMPQHNITTKSVAGMLYFHAQRGEDVSIAAHSQGTLIVRNALLTLEALGYREWIRQQVRFVAVGTPLRDVELPIVAKLTVINNARDPINVLARWEDLGGLNSQEHDFVGSYVMQIQNDMLWPSGNPDPADLIANVMSLTSLQEILLDSLVEQIGGI